MIDAIAAYNDRVMERDWAEGVLAETKAKGKSLVSVFRPYSMCKGQMSTFGEWSWVGQDRMSFKCPAFPQYVWRNMRACVHEQRECWTRTWIYVQTPIRQIETCLETSRPLGATSCSQSGVFPSCSSYFHVHHSPVPLFSISLPPPPAPSSSGASWIECPLI